MSAPRRCGEHRDADRSTRSALGAGLDGRSCRRAVGLLLDLHNLHANAINFGFDRCNSCLLPLARVGTSLAGGQSSRAGRRGRTCSTITCMT